MNPLFIRILEILLVPYVHKETIWAIAPLIFALIMLQMYFGKYKTEQLGWNTAFGNTISLMWVTAILLKYLRDSYGLLNAWQTSGLKGYFVIIIGLGLLTLILAIFNFNHLIPKKFAFLISSSLPTNGLAYFIIVIVIGKIPLDRLTFWATLIIFIFLAIVFGLYRKSITPLKSELPTIKKHEEEKEKLIKKIKRKIKYFFNKKIKESPIKFFKKGF
ncbi:MAG: hypothetical protein KAU20_02965 [Nanoarchaeota archaeon]|nr:hypothetical protein [Nanoarchaeota archaeon]